MTRQILVVDDDPHIREILIQRLRQRDHVVQGAGNGEEALTLLAQSDFDIVLLDLMMPGTGGTEVLRAMKALPKQPRVVVMSAVGSIWKSRSADAKSVEVLEKPLDFNQLLALIDG